MLGLLFTHVSEDHRVEQILGFLGCFSSGEFRTSPLASAHPSWSLVKSRPYDSRTILPHCALIKSLLEGQGILGTTTAKGRSGPDR